MSFLYQTLSERVDAWRNENYPCDDYPTTIVQRLKLEQGVFRAQITDWRTVVDCILIDTQHDGQVFNVTHADVPARKQDLEAGRYELPSPPQGSTVAVRVIDMLGKELLITTAA